MPWFDRGVQGLAVKGSKVQEAVIPAGYADDNVSTEKCTMHIAKDWTTEGDSEIELKGAEAIEFRADLMRTPPEKAGAASDRSLCVCGNSDAEVTQIAHPEFRDSSQPFVLKAHLRERLTNELGPGGLLLNPWMEDQYRAAAVQDQRAPFRGAIQQS